MDAYIAHMGLFSTEEGKLQLQLLRGQVQRSQIATREYSRAITWSMGVLEVLF